MKYFNLLDEPWIPVKNHFNQQLEVGVREILLNAHQYIEVSETEPANLISIYRLLLAILNRSLSHQKWNVEDKIKWFKGNYPIAQIGEYLDCYYEKFWFFHPEFPFMQVSDLAKHEKTVSKVKPWTQICLSKASGSTPTLFDHSCDGHSRPIPISHAIRHHLGFLQFVPGGLVQVFRTSDKAGPLADSAAVLPLGRNLAETLILALHPFEKKNQDYPIWELPPPTIKELTASPKIAKGINDLYTRLSRAILWLPSHLEGVVNELLFCNGLDLEKDDNLLDPMVCYKKNKNGLKALTFEEGRAFWRDLPSLIPRPESKSAIPPSVIGQSKFFYENLGEDNLKIPFIVAGFASEKAKILRSRLELMHLSQKILFNPDIYESIETLLSKAEEIYTRLSYIFRSMIAESMPESEHTLTRKNAKEVMEKGPAAAAYFSSLERFFPYLLEVIFLDPDLAFQKWDRAILNATNYAWEVVGNHLGASQKATIAKARFQGKLNYLKKSILEK